MKDIFLLLSLHFRPVARGVQAVRSKPPLWLLPNPLNAINIRSSARGVGQTCVRIMLIVECINWKIASNHGRMHQRRVEYEHGE